MIREEDISPCMAYPDCWGVASVPMCNGCKSWQWEKDVCKRYPKGIPGSIRYEEYHECPEFELVASGDINYKYVKANIERLKK